MTLELFYVQIFSQHGPRVVNYDRRVFIRLTTGSSSYGRKLAFKRLRIRIPAPDTGWTFFTFYYYKNCKVYLKRLKIN